MLGYHPPPDQAPPRPGTPLGADTPRTSPPGADTSLGADPPPRTRHPPGPGTPRSRHPPPEQTPPPGADPLCAVHAGRYGQQAGGMHPTGMQSCMCI